MYNRFTRRSGAAGRGALVCGSMTRFLHGALSQWMLAGTLVLAPASSAAATVAQATDRAADRPLQSTRVVQGYLHNDLFALRDSSAATDFDYTSGVGLAVQWADAPQWLRRAARGQPGCAVADNRRTGCLRAMLGISQAIFTPASNTAEPVRGQRPHAGALQLSGGAERVTARRRLSVQLDLGTSGRAALAEPVQGVFHALTGTPPELGWDNQVVSRLLLGLRLLDVWHVDHALGGAHLRTRAHWGGEAGTRRVAALAGAELRVAMNRSPFWTPTDGGTPLPLGPYVAAGVQQDHVRYDLFLDGFGEGPRPTSERIPGVWQASVALGWRFTGGQMEYRHVRRGEEYRAQVAPHAYGALAFTFNR